MALVTRNGRTYYYTCRRKNGRVKCEYRGSGELALFIAILDNNERECNEEERQAQAEVDDRQRQALEAEQARGKAITALVSLMLERSGFARYNRTCWKRRIMRSLPVPIATKGRDKKRITSEIRQLVNDLVGGDRGAVHRLQAIARDYPDVFSLEVECDVVEIARSGLADHEFSSEKMRDDLIARMHLVAAELAGPNPSISRRLCAEVASFAWAEAWIVGAVAGANGFTVQSLQLSRRLQAAQKRLHSALRTHAQIVAIEQRAAANGVARRGCGVHRGQ